MKSSFASLTLLAAGLTALHADPPTNYYATADGKAGEELRQAMHAIIRAHNVIPYSSSTMTDTSDARKVLDQDPANTNCVLLIFSDSNVEADLGCARLAVVAIPRLRG